MKIMEMGNIPRKLRNQQLLEEMGTLSDTEVRRNPSQDRVPPRQYYAKTERRGVNNE